MLEEKAWHFTKVFQRRRFLALRSWLPAKVRVVGVIMVVGGGTAVAVGVGIPDKLPVAPLNLRCPHEGMRGRRTETDQRRGRGNWIM